MPRSVSVNTIVEVCSKDTNLLAETSRFYDCRDSWIFDLGSQLRCSYQGVVASDRQSETELIESLRRVLSTGTTKTRTTIKLLDTTRLEDARSLANEVCSRYHTLDTTIAFELQDVLDTFLMKTRATITFIGNECAIAAAWWFMLTERIRFDNGGSTVSDILKNSLSYDGDQWYDSSDKSEHIQLWEDQTKEPNPRYWMIFQSGPIYAADHYITTETS